MCNFFSFITEPTYHPGQKFYFDWKYRKNHLNEDCDSHTMIAKHFELKEDYCNKYEFNPFNPLTKQFTVDQINNSDDSLLVEEWVNNLNFKKIVEPIIIKPIINPFDISKEKITKDDIFLLQEWDSVWDSVRDSVWKSVGDSVWDSVRDSVWKSVGDSVWKSVGDSVWKSVGDSVWDSVGDSVENSVWDSVWDSVRDSVRAYISTFLNIKYNYDFSSGVKLWNEGIVPSFDGRTWRLHSGKKADIVFEITKEDLENYK